MPADFSHLRKLDVDAAKTTRYELMELVGVGGKHPVLRGVFAGEPNRRYYGELVKRVARNSRRFRAGKLGARELEENRENDRELFPKFVITGWENMPDSHGQPAPFNPENCSAFLSALPDYIFDGVRNHFANPESFVEDGLDEPMDDEDAAALGNSSETGSAGT